MPRSLKKMFQMHSRSLSLSKIDFQALARIFCLWYLYRLEVPRSFSKFQALSFSFLPVFLSFGICIFSDLPSKFSIPMNNLGISLSCVGLNCRLLGGTVCKPKPLRALFLPESERQVFCVQIVWGKEIWMSPPQLQSYIWGRRLQKFLGSCERSLCLLFVTQSQWTLCLRFSGAC